MKQYYFISGLPRSGTTLLSTILNQNPRFQASISGPLARFSRAIIDQSSAMSGYRHQCPAEKRKAIIHNMFDTYYDTPDKEVFFDTNRGWGLLAPMIRNLYPYTKIILCVRDINQVLNSFEHLYRKNPYDKQLMIPDSDATTVYSRTDYLMRTDSTVGFAYLALKELITGEQKNMTMLIEYDKLASQPETIIRSLYNFISQPYFEHDYNNVGTSYPEFDADVNMPDLHTTRKSISFEPKPMILPPDIQQKYKDMEVWRY